MMSKKEATLVDQGGNSYLMNSLILSGHASLGHKISKPTLNGDTNAPYLLQSSLSPSYNKEEIPPKNKVNGDINPP